ncbi:MAG TPA: methyltransferase [Opitutaceae bacterium]|nr:methyltransferase [Opitutaceae bacterium]
MTQASSDPEVLIASFRHFQLIYVSLRLDLPRHLSSGPKTLEELANRTHVPADRLGRLVRGLLWAGMLESVPDGFILSPATRVFVDSAAGSPADQILFQGRFLYSAWGRLEDFMLRGEVPYRQAHGAGIFEQIAASKELAARFNRPMGPRSAEYSAAVAGLPLFDRCRRVVDVGGGEGILVADLLAAHAATRGVIFDLPTVRDSAEQVIRERQLGSRCEFIAGDMFAGVPAGGDVYLLKWILHDWAEERAVLILRRVRESMTESARLVVIERVMPGELAQGRNLAQADLNMLCLNGGAERTEREYAALLRRGGLAVESIVKLENRYGFHAIVAVRSG